MVVRVLQRNGSPTKALLAISLENTLKEAGPPDIVSEMTAPPVL